ncbi:efflux RND transporter periplasmic adaptor subunit [Mucilaginibacter myungsuensis]|uniref:Efflux RND transporter periplasmic adaptor subunit n=1 Tax=Mucilaginibacter myungsuensis TaxID=649104 RepID=A0A929KXX4_9SPHI|nr:efflux RND transporter periplasmic adaptor subunit [Mucilaginibacter myungsuensis]MBE9662687.1 efflux RND transporter periplasmic adaptor subunit [Mucilaginibacter myungsuensis]MDN3598107.1 efflux RND transporter periplasmic adaptor subunit [Mucilaginibacter myungsuensis]
MKKIAYIAVLSLLAACGGKSKDPKTELADLKKQQAELAQKIAKIEAENPSADSAKVTEVRVNEIKTGQFTNYVQIQGRIDAQDNVTAFPQAQGTITNIYVKAGQRVSKGQILAQLDNAVLKQQIAQGEAQLDLQRTVFQRQKNLWDQKIGTEIQYLQAKTNLEAGQKQLAAVKQQADMYTIKSPINGTVDQMDLKLGQAAAPGQTGIRIVNADALKVKADVPESNSGSISQGAKVTVVVPDAKDSVNTTLTFAAKVIDPNSRSFAVEVKLPQRKTLRPNMTAILKIANYTNNNAIIIPVKAVQRSENGDFVFINNNGVAKKVNVKVGATYAGQSEILSGLKAGDSLVTDGATDVEDGDKIKVLAAN